MILFLKRSVAFALFFAPLTTHAALPSSYTELNDFAIKSPNQSDAGTCNYMAATGAMEILLNKRAGNHKPAVDGNTDLSERFNIVMPSAGSPSNAYYEDPFLKYNRGEAVLARDIPFEFYDENGDMDYGVWNTPSNYSTAPRIRIPPVETVFLFSAGDQHARNVLNASHVEVVKEALVKYRSPVIAAGNDEEYWHIVVIVGYDDLATDGDCYELASSVCKGKPGAFYVRDSFGTRIEKRSYQWFIRRQNSASVAKFKD